MDRRHFISVGGLLCAGFPLLGGATFSAEAATKAAVKVYEYTFIKSIDPKPDDVIKSIIVNWFAIDEIAVKQGLMSNYAVFEVPTETEPWNVVVAVGYPTEKGYEDIVQEFEKIRSRHKSVLINDKACRELGRVVGSRKFFPRGGSK